MSVKMGVDSWMGGRNDFNLLAKLQASLRALNIISLTNFKHVNGSMSWENEVDQA